MKLIIKKVTKKKKGLSTYGGKFMEEKNNSFEKKKRLPVKNKKDWNCLLGKNGLNYASVLNKKIYKNL